MSTPTTSHTPGRHFAFISTAMWDPHAPRRHSAARDPGDPSTNTSIRERQKIGPPEKVTVVERASELSQAERARSIDRVSASTMPMQNGGWVVAVEAQQAAATKQPAARGRRPGAALAVLLVLLRAAAMCAAAASVALASSSATLRRAPFRFLLAADAIVAVYSAFEAAAAAWEVARGVTLLPEAMQLWFDFAHDQGFGYMALAAAATAARDAAGCGGGREGWTSGAAACVRADVAVGLGFVGFAFLAVAALVTGFRVACFLATGSRFPPPPALASY